MTAPDERMLSPNTYWAYFLMIIDKLGLLVIRTLGTASAYMEPTNPPRYRSALTYSAVTCNDQYLLTVGTVTALIGTSIFTCCWLSRGTDLLLCITTYSAHLPKHLPELSTAYLRLQPTTVQ